LVGDDFGNAIFEPLSMVFADFSTPNLSGTLGIIGPNRLPYQRIISHCSLLGNLINELLKAGKFL